MSDITLDEKIEVLEKHIVTLKSVWRERLLVREKYAMRHMAVFKQIAKEMRDLRCQTKPSES